MLNTGFTYLGESPKRGGIYRRTEKDSIWMFGNDYQETSQTDANMAAVIHGIRQYDTKHLDDHGRIVFHERADIFIPKWNLSLRYGFLRR